jgi:TolB protein
VRQVTRVGQHAEAPDWSPDGRQIVFSMLDGGLWVVNVDGTGVRQLIGGEAMWPSWSPDGRTVVFARGYPNYGLGALRLNGGKTRSLGRGHSAAWSPDGRQLAFVGNDEATWIMRADGTNRRRVARASANGNADVAWSPDGRRLVITRSTADEGLTLFVKTLDGGMRHLDGSGNAWAGDWSPNGRLIAFTRVTADNASDLFVISPRGGAARRLTLTPGVTR